MSLKYFLPNKLPLKKSKTRLYLKKENSKQITEQNEMPTCIVESVEEAREAHEVAVLNRRLIHPIKRTRIVTTLRLWQYDFHLTGAARLVRLASECEYLILIYLPKKNSNIFFDFII